MIIAGTTALTDALPSPHRLAAILVSRFLLDLQSANHRASNPQGATITLHNGGTGSLIFERVIGSLGSSIFDAVGEDEDEFDQDGDEECLAMETQEDLTDVGGQHLLNAKGESEAGLGVEMTTPSSWLESRLGATN